MFKIFIAETILKQVIETESKKPEASRSYLYKVMRMKLMKKVYVSAEAPDLAWAKTMEECHNIKADYSKSDYIRGIKDHPETVLLHPSSVFILDIPLQDAMNIQASYGVICLSGENASMACLIDVNDEQTAGDQELLGNGWETALKSLRNIPSNALLLTDRYLFSAYYPKAGNGIDNVRNILDTLLPKKFHGEYHVTIVFDNDNRNERYKSFNDIVSRLSTIRQALHRDYPVTMEILGITSDCEIYNDLHNRRIVSNYFIVKVEHKMAAFNKNISTCEQTITPQALFTVDSLNHNSTPPLKAIDHVIAAIRKFSRIASRSSEATDYFYALNDKRMERCTGIKNRLLK